MKYIITENKMEQVVIKYLNKYYGDLEEYRTNDIPDTVFYIKNKKVYMLQDLESRRLYVDYDTLWSDLKDTFSLEFDDIQSIIKKWAKVTYNLNNVNPCFLD